MSMTVGVHAAKTNFSRLLHRVEAGEEILITRGSQPVARIVPAQPRQARELGIDRGLVRIGEDFDAPLPEAILAEFEK
jgi:prevent-host-death family protein